MVKRLNPYPPREHGQLLSGLQYIHVLHGEVDAMREVPE